MDRRRNEPKNIDWMTIFMYMGLVVTGWLMIYATNYSPEAPSTIYDTSYRHGNQLIWIGISVLTGVFAMVVDSKFYRVFSMPIYVLVMVLLAGVLIFGQEVAGAKSWFNIGFFKLQPAEFAKFATCLALASYLSGFNVTLQENKARVYVLGILGLPMLLILLQPDAGSALVFTSFMILLFREGMPAGLYIVAIAVAVLSVVSLIFAPLPILVVLVFLTILLFIFNLKDHQFRWFMGAVALAVLIYVGFRYPILKSLILGVLAFVFMILSFLHIRNKKANLVYIMVFCLGLSTIYSFAVNYAFNHILKPHQQDRINVWLQPDKCDPLGSLYNLNQSKMAIGSGGIDGKGFLNGRITHLNYVPEQSTDFIFCTVGEEHGFLGSFALIFLYTALMLRIIFLAERQRSAFSRIYAYGVVGILFFHFFINIGMTIGLVPIIGIPLPFLSYGGSSLISFTILIAVLVKLDSVRLQSI